MPGLGNVYENKALDAIFGGDYGPATFYVALVGTLATDADTGSTIDEPSGSEWGGYSRVPVPNNVTNWPDAVSSQKTNGGTVTFPTSTGGAGSPWPAVGWVILDAASGGDVVTYGPLDATYMVGAGNSPSFAPGELVITAD